MTWKKDPPTLGMYPTGIVYIYNKVLKTFGQLIWCRLWFFLISTSSDSRVIYVRFQAWHEHGQRFVQIVSCGISRTVPRLEYSSGHSGCSSRVVQVDIRSQMSDKCLQKGCSISQALKEFTYTICQIYIGWRCSIWRQATKFCPLIAAKAKATTNQNPRIVTKHWIILDQWSSWGPICGRVGYQFEAGGVDRQRDQKTPSTARENVSFRATWRSWRS